MKCNAYIDSICKQLILLESKWFSKNQQFQLKPSQADESLIWVCKADIEGRLEIQ